MNAFVRSAMLMWGLLVLAAFMVGCPEDGGPVFVEHTPTAFPGACNPQLDDLCQCTTPERDIPCDPFDDGACVCRRRQPGVSSGVTPPDQPETIDTDSDTVRDLDDNCPRRFNPDQLDTDQDSQGDACDPDRDNDGLGNAADNCPLLNDPDQSDLDRDGMGDLCDDDDDDDLIPDVQDNCPRVNNPEQLDLDGDNIGDLCDVDLDGDSVDNDADNCPRVFNQDQLDTDDDGVGDACQVDQPPSFVVLLIQDTTPSPQGIFPGADIDAVALLRGENPARFADTILDGTDVSCDNNPGCAPEPALGQPDALTEDGCFVGGAVDQDTFVSLAGGALMLGFELDEPFESGDTIELYELSALDCEGFDDDDATTTTLSITDADNSTFVEIGQVEAGVSQTQVMLP